MGAAVLRERLVQRGVGPHAAAGGPQQRLGEGEVDHLLVDVHGVAVETRIDPRGDPSDQDRDRDEGRTGQRDPPVPPQQPDHNRERADHSGDDRLEQVRGDRARVLGALGGQLRELTGPGAVEPAQGETRGVVPETVLQGAHEDQGGVVPFARLEEEQQGRQEREARQDGDGTPGPPPVLVDGGLDHRDDGEEGQPLRHGEGDRQGQEGPEPNPTVRQTDDGGEHAGHHWAPSSDPLAAAPSSAPVPPPGSGACWVSHRRR